MDARTLRCLTVAFSFVAACSTTDAATHQTVNFAVTARNPEIAEQVGKAAEVYRQQLAIFWLGKPLPNWSRPCKITVNEGALGSGRSDDISVRSRRSAELANGSAGIAGTHPGFRAAA